MTPTREKETCRETTRRRRGQDSSRRTRTRRRSACSRNPNFDFEKKIRSFHLASFISEIYIHELRGGGELIPSQIQLFGNQRVSEIHTMYIVPILDTCCNQDHSVPEIQTKVSFRKCMGVRFRDIISPNLGKNCPKAESLKTDLFKCLVFGTKSVLD